MSDGDEILVDEEARGIMLALGKHDPEGPDASDVMRVTGPTSSAGSDDYCRAMVKVGSRSRQWFVNYVQIIQRDCANSVKALDDFSAQDAEIMALLRTYEEEAASATTQSSSVRTFLLGGGSPTNPGPVSPANSAGVENKSWGKSVGG